ncbi:iron exporter MbfA [Neokomagataea anthophila]|uniref:Rubrerythrin n=1 Tax=Neokomagataea anthophila TaxID=2826925 RepID=A0ABS5E6C8_9PROT|nr:ferritin family protein [Neokomagataea anthophila]MBR0559416.1 rubrerythrin [Neokomagataea anthophila]
MPRLSDLSEAEVLALAIASEEEDGHIYADFAEMLRENYPDSAAIFDEMAAEESQHRHALIDLFVQRFGRHIPLVRRQDVQGFPVRKTAWAMKNRGIEAIRSLAADMERQSARFYREAAARTSDAEIRRLLGDLAEEEDRHQRHARFLEAEHLDASGRQREEDHSRREFVLRVVQPGLVGLMDGSVSTLAPVFAAAFATKNPHDAVLVGLAASLGAGISMGLAEGLADDGKLSGRGAPLIRGLICGAMTFAGGIGHTLPFLVPDFHLAFAVAIGAVLIELLLISWIRWRYQDTPFGSALVQVLLGGALVFATGVVIGSS